MTTTTPARSRLLNLPNQLTIARLVLSLVFFVLLALLDGDSLGHGYFSGYRTAVLNGATALFILAVATDFLDGYFARKLHLESTFGRIADPFVDKIVICGGFILLTGVSESLVRPWFAVVIVFREFLVSGLRSFLESAGVAFGASLSGKLKMICQSVAIPAVLIYEANFAELDASSPLRWSFFWLTVALLGTTLALTLGSCASYLVRATRILKAR